MHKGFRSIALLVVCCCTMLADGLLGRRNFGAMVQEARPDTANLIYGEAVTNLEKANWRAKLEEGELWVVDFYAPWCPHCQHMAPKFSDLADWFAKQKVLSNERLRFGAVNCEKSQALCDCLLYTSDAAAILLV